MDELTRRGLLTRLAATWAAMAGGCGRGCAATPDRKDRIGRERACIHVLDPRALPAPLLEEVRVRDPPQAAADDRFGLGLPELMLCSTDAPLVDAFPWFWPFSHEDLVRLTSSVRVEFEARVVTSIRDVEALEARLAAPDAARPRRAVVFTLHDATRPFCARIAAVCRRAAVQELVVLKDPTLPPYLCDYPALQRFRFKKEPA